jgi:hypothetical protein
VLDTENRHPEVQARQRPKYLTGLLWHAGTFVIINAFFWLLDGLGAGGINWSPWITLFWGLALAFHGLAYWVDGRQIEDRKTREYTDEMR